LVSDNVGDKRRTRRVARFYHPDKLTINTELELDKESSHHLLTVLRARVGDALTVFNGDGFDYKASLLPSKNNNTRKACLSIENRTTCPPESPLAVCLVQAISRTDRMEITLRQSVESGVAAIQPVQSRHSAKSGDDKRVSKKHRHWQSIINSATEQSGRGKLPNLYPLQTFTQWIRSAGNTSTHKLVLSPTATESISSYIASIKPRSRSVQSITLIIGPESGLDADEIALAESHGFNAVHIGPRILRTETAGPACIVLLQTLLGDLQAS